MKFDDMWIPAGIGIGSNQDGPVEQIHVALQALADMEKTRLICASSLYRNPPMGPIEQPDYVNAAAMVLTRLLPRDLLTRLQALELAQGRVRNTGQRWGPRCIDLDILTYGYQQIDETDLIIPHPGISGRNFCIVPVTGDLSALADTGAGIGQQACRCPRRNDAREDSDAAAGPLTEVGYGNLWVCS